MTGVAGRKVAVLGGGRREAYAAAYLAALGAQVHAAGQPEAAWPRGVVPCREPAQALAGASLVLGPVLGIGADNRLAAEAGQPGLRLTAEALSVLPAGAVFCLGRANEWLLTVAREAGFRVCQLLEQEDFLYENAAATAEAALVRATSLSPRTVRDSTAPVTGFGRTGKALARLLLALGSRLLVAARRPASRAEAELHGAQGVTFSQLVDHLPGVAFCFNTVPASVLGAAELERLPGDAVVLDIASAPGGTDFAAAERRGLRAELALGLPGRYAPRTAGELAARVAVRLFAALA